MSNTGIKPNVVTYNNQGSMAVGAPSTTSTLQQKEGRYFIEFRSRYALTYGHTFVIFGRLDEAGQMIDPEVSGLAPATDMSFPTFLVITYPCRAETGASDGDRKQVQVGELAGHVERSRIQ